MRPWLSPARPVYIAGGEVTTFKVDLSNTGHVFTIWHTNIVSLSMRGFNVRQWES